jgi:hypothetical protein
MKELLIKVKTPLTKKKKKLEYLLLLLYIQLNKSLPTELARNTQTKNMKPQQRLMKEHCLHLFCKANPLDVTILLTIAYCS